MRYVYFTKLLRDLDVNGLVAFCRSVGVDGVDLAVRPGYLVVPDNVLTELPRATKLLRSEGLAVALVSAPTDLNDADSKTSATLFEAAARAGVAAIKIGYFPYRPPYDKTLEQARRSLRAFARLAERTGVRACYHTHSGDYLGNNAASLRWLLTDLDPHHVGAYLDTGHTAINGGPPAMELDTIRAWLSIVAIKDMAWQKQGSSWSVSVVPAGRGIVRWQEVGRAIKEVGFNGTISLHGEYPTRDLEERKQLARAELLWVKKILAV